MVHCCTYFTQSKMTYLKAGVVNFSLSVRKLHRLIAVRFHSNDGSVWEEVLLHTTRKQVLDCLVRKSDFFRSVWKVLLDLIAERKVVIKKR